MRTLALLAALLPLAACARRPAPEAGDERADAVSVRDMGRIAGERVRTRPDLPRTRAEMTAFAETSRHADVVAFLDSLGALGLPHARGSLGTTTEGREIPYVVLSRPAVRTPLEAAALRRPVVYLQANIHAGEVEGKEASLMLARDLLADPGPNVLDSVVVIVVPNYNADGNERVGPQARQRGEQNGPAEVGQRANAQGLDLNRDYVKAEAPETRAALRMLAQWEPDLFVDMHTTNGSYHGYALTYSPSLTPAAPLGAWTADVLLPQLRARLRARQAVETFDYGNFDAVYVERDIADSVKRGWWTYDHRPRFGTNYYGLRGGASVLLEAYSHDPFERRVRAMYASARELLSIAAERWPVVVSFGPRAGARTVPRAGDSVAVRARLTTRPETLPVLVEVLRRTGDSSVTEPGVPPGLRRTGRMLPQRMPVYRRFEPALARTIPRAWVLGAADTAAVRVLRLHGVRVDAAAAAEADGETFVVDSVSRGARPFQGHREVALAGRWVAGRVRTAAGDFVVPGAQPLARVAAYLLEPESDDGLATWNYFDHALRSGAAFPVRRLK